MHDEEEIDQSPASHHLANSLGVNAHRMQVMKASFFGEDDHHRPQVVGKETFTAESAPAESSIFEKSALSGSHIRPFQSRDSPGPTLSPRVLRAQNITAGGRTADSLFGNPKIGNFTLIGNI